jgi:hypothetical protein
MPISSPHIANTLGREGSSVACTGVVKQSNKALLASIFNDVIIFKIIVR